VTAADQMCYGMIADMFRDDLKQVERMLAVGNLPMARSELEAALNKLGQLEAIASKDPPAPQPQLTIEV